MMSSEKQVLQEGLSVSARVEFRALHETPLSRAFLHALLWFFLLAKTTDFEEQRAPSKLKTNLTVSSLSTAESEPAGLLIVSNEVIQHECEPLLS